MNAPDRFELFILPDGVDKYVLTVCFQSEDHMFWLQLLSTAVINTTQCFLKNKNNAWYKGT